MIYGGQEYPTALNDGQPASQEVTAFQAGSHFQRLGLLIQLILACLTSFMHGEFVCLASVRRQGPHGLCVEGRPYISRWEPLYFIDAQTVYELISLD